MPLFNYITLNVKMLFQVLQYMTVRGDYTSTTYPENTANITNSLFTSLYNVKLLQESRNNATNEQTDSYGEDQCKTIADWPRDHLQTLVNCIQVAEVTRLFLEQHPLVGEKLIY